MPDEPMTISVSNEKDFNAAVVRLQGPLVIAGMFQLQDILRNLSDKLVVVDLSGVPYMDSSGMGAILNGYVSAQKNGRELVVAGVNERVMALFQLTRVDTLLKQYSTVEAALSAAGK